jgi:hypothetical protein
MAIYCVLENAAGDPRKVPIMTEAYEKTDPITKL